MWKFWEGLFIKILRRRIWGIKMLRKVKSNLGWTSLKRFNYNKAFFPHPLLERILINIDCPKKQKIFEILKEYKTLQIQNWVCICTTLLVQQRPGISVNTMPPQMSDPQLGSNLGVTVVFHLISSDQRWVGVLYFSCEMWLAVNRGLAVWVLCVM